MPDSYYWPNALRRHEAEVSGDPFDLPSAPQFPCSYGWHLSPYYDDRCALEAIADQRETEREAIEQRMVAADSGNAADWPDYDDAAEAHDQVCHELALLRRRIEELGG